MKALITLLILLSLLSIGLAFPYATNESTFVASDIAQDYTNFSYDWEAWTDQKIDVDFDVVSSNYYLRLMYPKRGLVYLTWTNGTASNANWTATIDKTNFPLPMTYYAEFLGYDGTEWTNTPHRVLAKGFVIVHTSVYSSTNMSTWTNPLSEIKQ